MKKKQIPANTSDSMQEIGALQQKIARSNESSPADIERLRKLLKEAPDLLGSANWTMDAIREQLIEKISCGIHRAYILAEEDRLKRDFKYEEAPAIERLLIDQIMMARMRVVYVENLYNQIVVNESVSQKADTYLQELLSKTQNRFLRAVEALARVRKLSRTTPALQINIAGEGGQQVNVQNDRMIAQTLPPSSEAPKHPNTGD